MLEKDYSLSKDLDLASTGDCTSVGEKQSKDQRLFTNESNMRSDEKECLLQNRSLNNGLPQKRSRSNHKSEKLKNEYKLGL